VSNSTARGSVIKCPVDNGRPRYNDDNIMILMQYECHKSIDLVQMALQQVIVGVGPLTISLLIRPFVTMKIIAKNVMSLLLALQPRFQWQNYEGAVISCFFPVSPRGNYSCHNLN